MPPVTFCVSAFPLLPKTPHDMLAETRRVRACAVVFPLGLTACRDRDPLAVGSPSFTEATDSINSLPAIPDSFDEPGDTLVFPLTDDDGAAQPTRYYRTLVGVELSSAMGVQAFRELRLRYEATIYGGLTHIGAFVLELPDSGSVLANLRRVVDRLGSEPGVESAFPLAYSTALTLNARYPTDGPGSGRADYLSRASFPMRSGRTARSRSRRGDASSPSTLRSRITTGRR